MKLPKGWIWKYKSGIGCVPSIPKEVAISNAKAAWEYIRKIRKIDNNRLSIKGS